MAIFNGGGASGVSPQKFDTDIGEVKNLIQNVDQDVEALGESLQGDMEQLVTDVNDAVDEMQGNMQEALQTMPAGCPAPWLESISSASQEDGIKVTYKARFLQGRIDSTENWLFGQTKGVMFRYSTENYPMNRNEGTLAFVDEDLFSVDSSGVVSAKTKETVIVGLTNGETYFISAFPYSTYNVYNESLNQGSGLNNTTSCQWTGTKATLIVTITQDYNYNSLGEITVTATPTAGGDAKTGSRTGAGDVAISLDAGEYTVSVTAQQHFVTPANQTVNVTAGQPNTMNMVYQINKSLDDYTWNELGQMIRAGAAKNIFPVGSKKTMSGKKASFTYSNSSDKGDAGEYSTSDVSTQAILMDYDKDGANTASFITKDKMFYAPMHVNSSWNVNDSYSSYGHFSYYPSIRERIQAAKADMLPEEIRNNLKTVNKQTCDGTISEDGRATMNTFVSTTSDDVCIPSLSELGFPNIPRSKESPISYYYFSSDERRAELNGTTTRTSVGYYRSSSSYTGTSNYEITTNGTYGIETISGFSRYIDSSITFVIG